MSKTTKQELQDSFFNNPLECDINGLPLVTYLQVIERNLGGMGIAFVQAALDHAHNLLTKEQPNKP